MEKGDPPSKIVFPLNFQRIFQLALFNYQRVNWAMAILAKLQQEAAAFRWQCLENKGWKPWAREKAYWCWVGNGGMGWFIVIMDHCLIPYEAPVRKTKEIDQNILEILQSMQKRFETHDKKARNAATAKFIRQPGLRPLLHMPKGGATATFLHPILGQKKARSSISRCTCSQADLCKMWSSTIKRKFVVMAQHLIKQSPW